jgi:HD domain
MRECSYHYDHKTLNNHHLEGVVWTHTMMALSYAENHNMPLIIQWAALLHDIGRVYTRHENQRDGAVEFGDFEGVSCYLALEVMNKAKVKKKDQIRILKIISYLYTIIDHIKFNKPSLDEMVQDFKYEEALLSDLTDYVRCDLHGRFITESRKKLYAFSEMQQKINKILIFE